MHEEKRKSACTRVSTFRGVPLLKRRRANPPASRFLSLCLTLQLSSTSPRERVYENKSRRAPAITRGRLGRLLICLATRSNPFLLLLFQLSTGETRRRANLDFPRIRAQIYARDGNGCSFERHARPLPSARGAHRKSLSGWKAREFSRADSRISFSPRPALNDPATISRARTRRWNNTLILACFLEEG